MENNKDRKLRVLIVCGGTGGHMYPSVALANRLAKSNMYPILLISEKENIPKILSNQCSYEVKYMRLSTPTSPLICKKNIYSIFTLMKSILTAIRFIRYSKPNVVVGMGSYYMLPGMLAAKLCGLPLILYEQNVVVGKANRLMLPFAKSICVNFPQTVNFIKTKIKKVVVGMPQRQFVCLTKEQALEYFGLDKARFTLFLFGGSQGAHSINCLLSPLKQMVLDLMLQIIHISGPKDYPELKENLQQKYQKYIKIYPYLHNIEYGYIGSDLVISRAGAATITELIYFKKPAILIPYPSSSKNHQLLNALYLKSKATAIIVEEGPDYIQKVLYWVRRFYNKENGFQKMLNYNFNFIENYHNTDKFIEEIKICSQKH